MVKPWVMTGSSSAVRPFQQSSSTQRQPDRSTWRYISTEEFPASWPAIKHQQNKPQIPMKQGRQWCFLRKTPQQREKSLRAGAVILCLSSASTYQKVMTQSQIESVVVLWGKIGHCNNNNDACLLTIYHVQITGFWTVYIY